MIAFGDEIHNGQEMLSLAGTGHENANPALLPFADEQLLLTNEEDGATHFLQERHLNSIHLHTFGVKIATLIYFYAQNDTGADLNLI